LDHCAGHAAWRGELVARVVDLTVREPEVEHTIRRIYEEKLLTPDEAASQEAPSQEAPQP